ncbi:MAG TPA: hypothetical protein VNM87_14940, partial [Candidatus Udaeobacter sp.]|nr:hypothetical protein [Candidatus Udaeobacter sp.]
MDGRRRTPRARAALTVGFALIALSFLPAVLSAIPGPTGVLARRGAGPNEIVLELPPVLAPTVAPGPNSEVTVWVDSDFEVAGTQVLGFTGSPLEPGKKGPRVTVGGEHWLRGRKLVTLLVEPWAAHPETGGRTTEIHLKLLGHRGHSTGIAAAARRPRPVPWEAKIEEAIAKGPGVDLREAPLSAMGPIPPTGPWPPSPTFRPTADGSPVEYVIVTNAALAGEFQR